MRTFMGNQYSRGTNILLQISKFYNPTDSEHKLHKTRIENWVSIGFELESSWLGTYSHNHYTIFSLEHDGEF